MKKIPKIDSLVQIPEKIVIAAYEASGQDEEGGFHKVLQAAESYREANMTPVFVLDQINMQIYCYATETLGKRLH